MSPRIKYIFAQERKAMFFACKKTYFCLSHDFQTLFRNADHLLYYPETSVFYFHDTFALLDQFLRNGTERRC